MPDARGQTDTRQGREAASCGVCGSYRLETFLSRRGVPALQNLLAPSERRATEVPRGDLRMVACEDCGYVSNRAFDPSKVAYGEDYENAQTCSPAFRAHFDDTVAWLVEERGVRARAVVEVGCGDGSFLRQLVCAQDGGNVGHGYDPSYIGPLVDLGGRVRFEQRYYDPSATDVRADVVVCRHVIEHIDDPVAFLKLLRRPLAGSSDGRVFLETPCVEWILTHRVIWDFFYEHCSLFTRESLGTALEVAGFEVASVRHVFDGQYLLAEARISDEHGAGGVGASSIGAQAREFAASEKIITERWQSMIRKLASTGKVALWGAGAKGVTLANLVDPAREWIDCVIDINPKKQGCYVAGAGHPIVDFREIRRRNVTAVVLMNPNYRAEIQAALNRAGLQVEIVEAAS